MMMYFLIENVVLLNLINKQTYLREYKQSIKIIKVSKKKTNESMNIKITIHSFMTHPTKQEIYDTMT